MIEAFIFAEDAFASIHRDTWSRVAYREPQIAAANATLDVYRSSARRVHSYVLQEHRQCLVKQPRVDPHRGITDPDDADAHKVTISFGSIDSPFSR